MVYKVAHLNIFLNTSAVFRIYDLRCERGDWRPCIKVLEITSLIMETHGKMMELCF